jgi:hypothetical protein
MIKYNDLDLPLDIRSTSFSFRDVRATATRLFAVTSTPLFKAYDIENGQELYSLTPVSGACGIAIVNDLSAILVSNTNNQVDFIQLSSGYRTLITSGASTVNTNTNTQQVTAVNGIAIATRAIASTVMKITASAVSQLTVTGMTGIAKCATCDLTSGTYFLGTTDGKIHEINSSGTLLATVTLPCTPGISVADVDIFGISVSLPYVAVTTGQGYLYIYNWSTGTIKTVLPIMEATATTNGVALCDSVSGYTAFIMSRANGSDGMATSVMYFKEGVPYIEQFEFNNSGQTGIGSGITEGWLWSWTNDANANMQLRRWEYPTFANVNVGARIDDPEGTPRAGTVIRIIDGGIGKKRLQSVTDIGAFEQQIACTDDRDYIEIVDYTQGTNKTGFREFTA